MKTLGNITSSIELEEHCGLQQPKDPYKFANEIQYAQERKLTNSTHKILFNKGRYFETSFYDKNICEEVSELIQSPIQYNDMIVASWRKLEDFVIAMNCLEVYVIINIDWI